MFGSVNMMPDYTFTDTDTRLYSLNITKALSSYLGENQVRKNNKESNNETSTLGNKSDDSITKSKNKEKKDEEFDSPLNNNISSSEDEYEYGLNSSASTSITNSFTSLAAAVGSNSDKISKQQLLALLQSLISSGDSQEKLKEIAFVKNLIAQFDTLSDGKGYITSLIGVNEPQDHETITKEQVTSPIDLRI